jgi:hypothetical protein
MFGIIEHPSKGLGSGSSAATTMDRRLDIRGVPGGT